jgi:DNA-binding response OmpR family regulator
MKILIVEDNIELNKTIKNFLEMKEFNVDSAFDGITASKYIKNSDYDLYIMDIHLPKKLGTDLIKQIRDKNISSPIIMMTSLQEVEPFVESFKNGCNEYIKKPFHFEELEIRINNLLKNIKPQYVKINQSLQFDIKNLELIKDNSCIKLRKKEKRLLAILIQNINNTITTQELIDFIWEYEKKDNYPLRQLISSLKRKVQELKPHIQSVSKIGYRFVVF